MAHRRFLTPDLSQLAEAKDCRCVELPGSLWPLLNGAISELIDVLNWEQHGDATTDETAEFFYQVYRDYLMSNCAIVGEVRAFAGAAPASWLPLDGTAVDAGDYAALAAVVPASWLSGGDILLPDMMGRGIVGPGTGYDLGDIGGEETHTLTIAEMPAHTHSYELAVVATDILGELPAPALNALTPAATGSTGSGDAHNNMQPFLVLNYAIFAGV